jgi:hypothetical protein
VENSTRSGTIRDGSKDRKAPSVREADRAGRSGDAPARQDFTIRPKTAVIEIRAGRVSVKVSKKDV